MPHEWKEDLCVCELCYDSIIVLAREFCIGYVLAVAPQGLQIHTHKKVIFVGKEGIVEKETHWIIGKV